MSKNFFVRALAVACLMATPLISWGTGSTGATVSITGTVDAFAEWADTAPVIAAADWDAHITAVDTAQTVTKVLTLYTNATVTITPTAGANSGILTNGSQTLITQYKLTGATLAGTADSAYKLAGTAAGQFFNASNNLYTITHSSGTGSYDINLVAQMQSQSHVAPDAGDYTAGVVLTASW
jgi:hypothetical protein